MDEVFIDPPYQEHTCRGNEQSREHIIKIVSIFWSQIVTKTLPGLFERVL